MPRRVISYAPVLALALGLCVAIAFKTKQTLAAGDCLVQPNREQAEIGHWYYRADRLNHRKCWYLVEPRTPQAEPEARPGPDTSLQPTLSSFFSFLSADLKGVRAEGTRQDAPNRDAGSLQTGEVKNDDVPRPKRPHTARHPDSNTVSTPQLGRQSPAEPHVDRANQPPPLDTTERDALFQEFLRWKPNERPPPRLNQAEREALFREFLRWEAQ